MRAHAGPVKPLQLHSGSITSEQEAGVYVPDADITGWRLTDKFPAGLEGTDTSR